MFVAWTATGGTAAAVAGLSLSGSRTPPLALVYRGPDSPPGCSEAVAGLLARSGWGFEVAYTGPGERRPLDADTLSAATLYAHPGGGELMPAWRRMRRHAEAIREFVHNGGCYLGFCLGGYLAGATPGFGLLPGDSDQYAGSPGAGVCHTRDTVLRVRWRDQWRDVYFQDGPYFRLRDDASATVLARYDNSLVASAVVSYGAGSVGVVGPHPEATPDWYADRHLTIPTYPTHDLGLDLINTTMQNLGSGE